ncbi:MAG: hypothetical protein KatS3mg101_1012 [Patescibacteria group bacterium]|nr:MAG: hypothetical protein KatS3mg101_1012 [Patescibacteria group bacterium]
MNKPNDFERLLLSEKEIDFDAPIANINKENLTNISKKKKNIIPMSLYKKNNILLEQIKTNEGKLGLTN